MNIYETVIGFIDRVFSVPITFIDLAIDNISNISLVTAQGIDLSQYFSLFYDLPSSLQMVVGSLIMSVVLLANLHVARAVTRLYFAVKDGVKWW